MPAFAHDHASLFVGAGWSAPATDRRITVTSANTGRPFGSVPEAVEADVDRAVAAAREAFDAPAGWAHWEPARRADALERLAEALEKRSEETARLVSVLPHLGGPGVLRAGTRLAAALLRRCRP